MHTVSLSVVLVLYVPFTDLAVTMVVGMIMAVAIRNTKAMTSAAAVARIIAVSIKTARVAVIAIQ